jgi:hypothetical protein
MRKAIAAAAIILLGTSATVNATQRLVLGEFFTSTD